MQSFALNIAMANLCSLEDTVRLYAKVMTLWRQYTRVLCVPHVVVKYEDLVDDFEHEVRRLLEFIGVEWDESILTYNQAQPSDAIVRTLSYHQVSQPIYRSARYRWRRYERYIEPIRPILQPHIREFGYTDD